MRKRRRKDGKFSRREERVIVRVMEEVVFLRD
jgi:hypothetical protein